MLDQQTVKRKAVQREKLARHGQFMLGMGFSLSDVLAEMDRRSESESELDSAVRRLGAITGSLF